MSVDSLGIYNSKEKKIWNCELYIFALSIKASTGYVIDSL